MVFVLPYSLQNHPSRQIFHNWWGGADAGHSRPAVIARHHSTRSVWQQVAEVSKASHYVHRQSLLLSIPFVLLFLRFDGKCLRNKLILD
jgi:hypothetical protein